MFSLGIIDHLEGPADRPSGEIFDEVADLVRLADSLGVRYAWFAEHHHHAHFGHMPIPLIYALHLAGQTRRIHLGSAVVCLNLHRPIEIAEQVATADILADGRMAFGFGSGATPEESRIFDVEEIGEAKRHERFESALRTIFDQWRSKAFLPKTRDDVLERCWVATNSNGAAQVAGRLNLNVLFSHLRTPQQYREYIETYRSAGGRGCIAANRPVFVGEDDASAREQAIHALRILWRRFQKEGKIPANLREPDCIEELCAHPINFIIGGPETVRRELQKLHDEVPFDVLNVEVRWEGLPHQAVCESLRRLTETFSSSL